MTIVVHLRPCAVEEVGLTTSKDLAFVTEAMEVDPSLLVTATVMIGMGHPSKETMKIAGLATRIVSVMNKIRTLDRIVGVVGVAVQATGKMVGQTPEAQVIDGPVPHDRMIEDDRMTEGDRVTEIGGVQEGRTAHLAGIATETGVGIGIGTGIVVVGTGIVTGGIETETEVTETVVRMILVNVAGSRSGTPQTRTQAPKMNKTLASSRTPSSRSRASLNHLANPLPSSLTIASSPSLTVLVNSNPHPKMLTQALSLPEVSTSTNPHPCLALVDPRKS
jgi:hypothetical protein